MFIFWLIPAFGLESKGGFGLCGVRPGSTWTGQHTHIIRARRGNKDSGLRAARLDRAGPQARTHFRLRAGLVRWLFLQILNILDQCLNNILKFCIFLTITVDFIARMHDRGMISSKNLTNFRQ